MISSRRRVVVTGIGAVTAAGIGVDPFWRSAVEGRSHLAAANGSIAARFGAMSVGTAPLPPEAQGERAGAAALLATKEALRSARLHDREPLPPETGIVLGTCLGGMAPTLDWIDAMRARGISSEGRGGSRGPDAPAFPSFPVSGGLAGPTRRVAHAFELLGPVVTLSTACSSGAAAIAEACGWIRDGGANLMLAGGAESLTAFVLSGFAILQALTHGRMRPFDRRRDGLALGEGAAIVVLEERRAAQERGAPILAEVLGAGVSSDAHHMTSPAPGGEGIGRAIDAALADARLTAAHVSFVNAHGTGTVLNDRAEASALVRLFRRGADVPVNAVKPVTGHTLGAAGALEAILCVRAIGQGLLPPTIGCDEPEPDFALDVVRGAARRQPVATALSLSCGFGGHNVALLLGEA